ncbi:hypothetical protein KJ570_02805 [Patescibacteria group bacterium]|nr:hypothetical protein [Patescibacteria group bacterium]MBU2036095.1 hypothetical protein [Patescibacteria group bacterium]
MKKVKKTQEQLVIDLKEQIGLLEDAIQKVNSGDFKYSKTLSGILRILVIKTPTNKPLLFSLAQEYGFMPKVVIDSPFGIKTTSLKKHLKALFFASGTEKISISNEEFIKIASQQDGGSHVDPEIDFGYQFANEGILIGGFPPKVLKLRILANHVLKVSKELLSAIETKNKL